MLEIHEEAHIRYAQHLAEAMGRTKEAVVASIWEMRSPLDKPWEKEIDFNE